MPRHTRSEVQNANALSVLSRAEADELGERIANGDISRACLGCDWFNVTLSNGVRCVGVYRHGMDNYEYSKLAVYRRA